MSLLLKQFLPQRTFISSDLIMPTNDRDVRERVRHVLQLVRAFAFNVFTTQINNLFCRDVQCEWESSLEVAVQNGA